MRAVHRNISELTTRMLLLACLMTVLAAVSLTSAQAASRIKDIADFEGIRENQLIGYGLVVGLNGTGDSLNNTPFTPAEPAGNA